LDARKLIVALELDVADSIISRTRELIVLSDEEKVVDWEVPSLRALFRGDELAPPPSVMERYPKEFTPLFYLIESNLLLYAEGREFLPTDAEVLGVFSAMRRRPDGRSLGSLHDFVWMNTAFMLGKYRCSEALYTAIMNRLERSVRSFKMGPTSRNYMSYICEYF
jgi:hypothetical protein